MHFGEIVWYPVLGGKSLRWRPAQYTTIGGIFWHIYTGDSEKKRKDSVFIISPFLFMPWFLSVQFSSLKHQTVKANGAYVSTKCNAKSSGNKKRIKANGIQDSFHAAGSFFALLLPRQFFYIPCDDIWQVGTIGAAGDQKVAQTKNSIQET